MKDTDVLGGFLLVMFAVLLALVLPLVIVWGANHVNETPIWLRILIAMIPPLGAGYLFIHTFKTGN